MKEKIIVQIQTAVQSLSIEKQIAFTYLMAFRLSYNYKTFCKQNNWGSPYTFDRLLLAIKGVVLNKQKISNIEEKLIDEIENIAPDTNDFGGNILATAALDACGVLYETLEFMSNNNNESLETIISLSLNAIQMYIEDVNNYDYNIANYDEQVYGDDIMISEILFQYSIITKLTLKENVNEHYLSTLEIVSDFSNRLISTQKEKQFSDSLV